MQCTFIAIVLRYSRSTHTNTHTLPTVFTFCTGIVSCASSLVFFFCQNNEYLYLHIEWLFHRSFVRYQRKKHWTERRTCFILKCCLIFWCIKQSLLRVIVPKSLSLSSSLSFCFYFEKNFNTHTHHIGTQYSLVACIECTHNLVCNFSSSTIYGSSFAIIMIVISASNHHIHIL